LNCRLKKIKENNTVEKACGNNWGFGLLPHAANREPKDR
jgi:hypothetical protein